MFKNAYCYCKINYLTKLRLALVANYIMMNSDVGRMIAITFSAILFCTSTAAILCALRS